MSIKVYELDERSETTFFVLCCVVSCCVVAGCMNETCSSG